MVNILIEYVSKMMKRRDPLGRCFFSIDITTDRTYTKKFNFETWKVKPEITPKGASYYLHDERSRDDMNFWERKQYFLATGQSPRLGPPTRGRGSFRSRGAPRPYRGRGARGSTRGFTSKRGGGNEMEWKHDKFSEINKESEKESKKEVKKSDRKEKHKRKKSKENGKEKDDKKKKNIKDKEKDKSNKRNESEDTRKSKVNKGEIAETEGKKGKVKSEGTDRETAKGGSEAIDTGNVGPNFSNLLTLT